MKIWKKVKCTLIMMVFSLVLSANVMNANAEEIASGTWDNLTWSIENDTLTITGSGTMKEAEEYPWNSYQFNSIVIGDEVTSIAKYAFGDHMWNSYSEHNLTLGKSVTEIGDSAFSGNLFETVEFPASLKKIGNSAFAASPFKELVIPDNVTEIGQSAFVACRKLERLEIGDGLTIIPESAFAACTGLTTVTLGDSITTIERNGFVACTALTTVYMGENVTTIGDFAFQNCSNLTTIKWSENIETIGVAAFLSCGIQEFVMGDSLEQILDGAFATATNLKSVTVGDSVSYLGMCFYNVALESFTTYSMSTEYHEDTFGSTADNFVIYGWPGSTAETFANEKGYTFKALTPSLEKITTESKGVHVYWNEFPYAQTYSVYRSTSKASGYSLIKSGVISTDYVDTTVKSGTTYYYKIVAVRDSAKTGFSAATNGITYLAAPTFKKVVNVVSGVHVYWNASTGAKTYSVYRSTKKDSGYTLVKSGLTATHYIDTTAKSGTTYYYKIVAVNGSAKSAFSAPFNAITYVGTPDITSRANSAYGVRLGWDKISGATGYAIYRKPYEGTTWVRVATIKGNSTFTWMDESVKTNNGTVYKYTIRALAGSDMKTLSGCRSTGRTMARLTSRTLNSAVKASATSIKCNWSTTSVCNGYEVRFMVGDTVYKTFTVGNYKTGVKTFTGLKAGQTYKIQVRSYKKVAGVGTFYSAWSTAKTVRL